MNKSKIKILLTGGSGFIGKNIKESYLAEKYNIIAPRSFELNLEDNRQVGYFFQNNNFDVILHAGCKPAYKTAKDFNNVFYSNLKMFYNLVRNKNHYGKLINFGSGAVYGIQDNITNAKEEDIFKRIPQDEYGFSKYIFSDKIKELDNFVDLNLFGVFGKYEHWQFRFISNAICKAIYDLPITLRQNRKFSYLDINDLMPILENFIEKEPKFKTYNIVPDEYLELLDVAKLIKEISGKNIDIQVAKDGFGLDYYGNNSRLKNEFDVKFTKIKFSIEHLYTWYNQNKNNIDKKLLLEDL